MIFISCIKSFRRIVQFRTTKTNFLLQINGVIISIIYFQAKRPPVYICTKDHPAEQGAYLSVKLSEHILTTKDLAVSVFITGSTSSH